MTFSGNNVDDKSPLSTTKDNADNVATAEEKTHWMKPEIITLITSDTHTGTTIGSETDSLNNQFQLIS